VTDQQCEVAGEIRTVLQQTLNWDELNPQQRMAIVNAVVPSCFPFDSRRFLANKPWAEIHARTQLALATVTWEQVISGGVQ
jgi:hypothetical protein